MTGGGELLVVPTRRCNLSCPYCPVEKRGGALDPAAAARAAGAFLASGGGRVRLTGGEPLLAWETVARVVEAAAPYAAGRAGALLEVCTNGTLLDGERLSLLDRPWIGLVVSVDGGWETMRAGRLAGRGGRAAFERLRALLADPRRAGRLVVTQTIAPRPRGGAFDDFLFLWGSGARRFNFLPVYYRRWGAAERRALADDLAAIAGFVGPFVAAGAAEVRNLSARGPAPLFSRALCLDADGAVYFSNAHLLAAVAGEAHRLRLSDGLEGIDGKLAAFDGEARLAAALRASFGADVLRANRAVDAHLDRFVEALRAAGARRPAAPPARAARGRPERLELHLSYRCTNDCVFCSERARMRRFARSPVRAIEAWRAIERHARAGGRHLNLTGGEPTLHPAFTPLLEGAKALGLRTYVGTNGARTCDPAFAARALPFVDELCLSIHGPDEETHRALTGRPGGLGRLLETARNAGRSAPRPVLMANMVVTRRNAAGARRALGLCASIGASQLLVSNPSPEGRALERYRRIVLPLGRWPALAEELARAADGLGVVVRFFGLPFCALGEARMKSNDLYFDPRVTVERRAGRGGAAAMGAAVTRHPRRGRVHLPACRGCSMRRLCGGVFGEHVRVMGSGGVHAIG